MPPIGERRPKFFRSRMLSACRSSFIPASAGAGFCGRRLTIRLDSGCRVRRNGIGFALQSPSVTVALMAPDHRAELVEDLTVLDAEGPLSAEEYDRLAEHGRRVRRYAGSFP